jgi:hypothetical protein
MTFSCSVMLVVLPSAAINLQAPTLTHMFH